MNDEELIDEMVQRLGTELKRVLRQVRRGGFCAAALEGIIQSQLWHVGSQAMGVMLEALGRELVVGRRVHDYRTRTVISLFGALDVSRARCRDGDRWCYPLDEAMGLLGQRPWTVGVQEAVSLLSCECSFETVGDLMARLTGVSISAPTVQEIAEAVGDEASGLLDEPYEVGPVPDTLIIATDGCQTPQRDGWHEAKLATLYSKAACCGKPGRRVVLLQKEYVATLEAAEAFGQRLWERARGWGVEQVRRVVVMGDGAAWIWNLSALHFPGATEIVDFYHAAEHLWAVGEALWGDRQTSEATRSWVRRYRKRLREGRVDLVLAAIGRSRRQRAGRVSADQAKVVGLNEGYFQRNAARMRYGRFRQMGLPIGTGAVEGACKHVIQSRFKRPGTRWSGEGLRRMLALKVLRLNHRWHQLWPHLEAA